MLSPWCQKLVKKANTFCFLKRPASCLAKLPCSQSFTHSFNVSAACYASLPVSSAEAPALHPLSFLLHGRFNLALLDP